MSSPAAKSPGYSKYVLCWDERPAAGTAEYEAIQSRQSGRGHARRAGVRHRQAIPRPSASTLSRRSRKAHTRGRCTTSRQAAK
jgi:hypothetical protein